MQNLVLTQLSIPEVRQLFRETLETFFAEKNLLQNQIEADEIGGIDLAVKITNLAKPTIYGLASDRLIPHSKRGKRLYFSRNELLKWLADGKRKTQDEIRRDAENFQPTRTKNATPATV